MPHRVFERRERGIIAGSPQITGLGLGEILVAVADLGRHVDIFDGRRAAQRREHGADQVAEAARRAGADVENARHFGRGEQPAHHADGVVHIDEIAFLLAIGDARAVRLEQPDGLAGLGVVEPLGDEAHHFALVILVGAEHVEEFQPRPLRRHLLLARGALDHGHVEHMLAPAVEIHRLEFFKRADRPVVGKAVLAVAESRGRRGVDQRRARRRAPFQQAQRQPEIVFHDRVAIGRGGRGDGAHMHHGLELAAVEPAQKIGRRHKIGDLAMCEIAPLAVAAENVVDGNVGAAGLVEARHHIRSDEPGPAGDQQHRRFRPVAVEVGLFSRPDRSFAPVRRDEQHCAALSGVLGSTDASQAEIANPEKSQVATRSEAGRGAEQTFRYAPLSSGLDIVRKTGPAWDRDDADDRHRPERLGGMDRRIGRSGRVIASDGR